MYSEYYTLRFSNDPKEIGINDGGVQVYLDEEKYKNIEEYNRYCLFNFPKGSFPEFAKSYYAFPKKDFVFEYLRLDKKAKITDFLSYSEALYWGGKFLLSPKAIEVLNKFKLSQFRLYKANLYQNGVEIKGYKVLHCPMITTDFIDFGRCIFVGGSEIEPKYQYEIPISNIEDWLAYKKKDPLIYTKKLCLNKDFDRELDLFNTHLSPDTFVSQRLKIEIENKGLTGAEIRPSNVMDVSFIN
ncbi:hypothetical protein [Marinoscillum pacificum]|uniref:hypothetical protein n=1 Tax=Marinoscillum pacificum TaxID=392723 RepID=UPI00215715A5|nr:hypothetical protein [Marinoscillum pacificum]